MKVKICGLRTVADVAAVNAAKPDYAGFVFAESPRRITEQDAAALRVALLPEIVTVGVFVNAPLEQMIQLVRTGVIGMVQLHGDEDDAFVRAVKEHTGAPVIRAFRVGDGLPDGWGESSADYLLFDKLSGKARGGTGERFDWELLRRVNRPFFLAGGMRPGLAEHAAAYAPFAVDGSSGVETEGIKDPQKIAAFVREVRATTERMEKHEQN